MNVDIYFDNKRENYVYTGLVLIQLPQALVRWHISSFLQPLQQFPKHAE